MGMTPTPGLIGLNPSANISGGTTSVPSVWGAGTSDGAVGGATNPFTTPAPTGQNMPSSPSFPANTGTGGGTGGSTNPTNSLANLDLGSFLGAGAAPGPAASPSWKDVMRGFQQAGFPRGVAGLLGLFLASGAGYNPQVAQALLTQMQPGISRGEADITEQFAASGLRDSSSAQIGLGDYLSQVQLNEGEILSQLYEQSVQDYMNVLLGGKAQPKPQGGGLLGLLGSVFGAAGSAFQGAGTAAVAGGGGADAGAALADVGTAALAF